MESHNYNFKYGKIILSWIQKIGLSKNDFAIFTNKIIIMDLIFAIGMPGGWEWIIIGLIVVIFFGANKITEIFRGFWNGIREIKDSSREIKKEI